jgi:hypothetical protein
MRETNNPNGKSAEIDSFDNEEHYVIFDTDTNEYLTLWGDYEGAPERWQALDMWGDDAYEQFYSFDRDVLSPSLDQAMDLLKTVAEELCDRFPDEQVNLIVKRIRLIVARSVEEESACEVQTFGEEPEAEPRPWSSPPALDDEEEDDGWDVLRDEDAPPPAPKPKKAKKAKKSTRR